VEGVEGVGALAGEDRRERDRGYREDQHGQCHDQREPPAHPAAPPRRGAGRGLHQQFRGAGRPSRAHVPISWPTRGSSAAWTTSVSRLMPTISTAKTRVTPCTTG